MIRDLLSPSSGFLDLREDSRGSIQIAGITEVSTSNAQEVRVTGPTEGHVAPPRQPHSPGLAEQSQTHSSKAASELRVQQASVPCPCSANLCSGQTSPMDLALFPLPSDGGGGPLFYTTSGSNSQSSLKSTCHPDVKGYSHKEGELERLLQPSVFLSPPVSLCSP